MSYTYIGYAGEIQSCTEWEYNKYTVCVLWFTIKTARVKHNRRRRPPAHKLPFNVGKKENRTRSRGAACGTGATAVALTLRPPPGWAVSFSPLSKVSRQSYSQKEERIKKI